MSALTPIIVTGCQDCRPFNSRGQWPYCNHPEAVGRDGGNDIMYGREHDGAMSWCPLRRSPAMVVLRPGGEP